MPLSPATKRVLRTEGPAALNGVLAAGLAVAATEFTAAFVRREAAPLVTVGQSVIDRTPRDVKEWAVRQFGTDDKLVLRIAVGVVLLIFAALIGMLARRWLWTGVAGVAVLGVVTVGAAVSRPADRDTDVIPAIVGAVVGAVAIVLLTRPDLVRLPRRARTPAAEPPEEPAADGPPTEASGPGEDTGLADPPPAVPAGSTAVPAASPLTPSRRTLLLGSVGAGAVLAGLGRWLQNIRFDVGKSRANVVLPAPVAPAPAPAAGTDLGLPGLSPYVTPNKSFYRIDTALVVPEIRAEDWKLRIHGKVDREIEIDFATLSARPTIERDITLACVSNDVGGEYVGNARWLGVPLADLLREAGVHPDADQLVSRSFDGMTIGTPTATVMDGRDAILAIGMNGEPLPIRHGFPVRMVVPGLYGYVSACKWITEIEATTFADYDAYWVQRGWAEHGPIKTQSRIDTPKNMSKVARGRVPVAGVAWAQHTGIANVEIQIDDEPWQQAQLAAENTVDTWRQFVWYWNAKPGPHRIRVRATDRTGAVQTDEEQGVAPDGATGWHTISMTIT
ncbi:molybdopterin-dependent oxidoreductase [Yinghuangia sp. ASG 101]|uniref:molybdopterin-dependent oxidoreductase n=1 Tax=Yinghuangia sp. ASG 101 TaxID=2896848 RepID=UPI001E40B506|nr:molybdopterin-dependent oxidoreductase [Yinghuangia sp. ASG 101]UGQ09607.1 molybdopterin-dependent oxidoreductase [Yinghuangia sp. ASG 101]